MYKVKNFFMSALTLASCSGMLGSAPEVQKNTLSWGSVAALTLPVIAIGAGCYLWSNYSKRKPLQARKRLLVTSQPYAWLNIPQEIDDKRWSEWHKKDGAMPYEQLEKICQEKYKNMSDFVRAVIEKTDPYLQAIKRKCELRGYPMSGLPRSAFSWIFPVREVVSSSDNSVCEYYKLVKEAPCKGFASELLCTPSGVLTAEIHYPSITDLDDIDAKRKYASTIMHEMVHLVFLHRAYYPRSAGGKKELHRLEFEADALALFIGGDDRAFIHRLSCLTEGVKDKSDLGEETDTHPSKGARIGRILTSWAAYGMVATGKTKEDAIQHVTTKICEVRGTDDCYKKIVKQWADRHYKGLRGYAALN